MGGVLVILYGEVIIPLLSKTYKAEREQAGFPPDQAHSQPPSARRRHVFGKSYEG